MRVGFANLPLFLITSPGPRIGAVVGEVIPNKGDDRELVGVSGTASACWLKKQKICLIKCAMNAKYLHN